MNILITGITGFVGGYLAKALAAEPEAPEIHGTAYPQPPGPDDKNVVLLDLREEGDVRRLVRDVRPDWVFHLAAVSNVRSSWQARRETLETNVLGTQNLLEAIRVEAPRARTLFISSSDVYGATAGEGGAWERKIADVPISENTPFRILNPYAWSKAAGEMMCGFYERVEGLDIVIARPFPHTGPGQAADFVCGDWARQIVRIERGESEPVLRVGNLDVRRDFSDVRDVVAAYVALMRKGRRGQVYNVCSGKAVTLHEILDFFIGEARLGLDARAAEATPGTPGSGAASGVPRPGGQAEAPKAGVSSSGAFGNMAAVPVIRVEVDPTKLRKTDVPLLVGDNRKIVTETGWHPLIPIAQTLRDVLSGVRS